MNNNPKIAVIGAGNWGKNHIRVFSRLGYLVAVADADELLREKVHEQYPDIAIHSSHLDLINNSDIDAVVIATPVVSHYSIAKDFLLADKDVLVEKPMTLSVEDAEDLISIAENRKKVLMVGQLLHYKPAVKEILECVKEGQIGNLRNIEMRRIKLGKVRSQENVLWSFSPHDISVLLELVSLQVKKVTSNGLAIIQPKIEDDFHVHLEFENNIQAHIHASWLWPEDERKTIIIGTEGMIIYDEHENKIWLHQKGVRKDLSIWDEGRREILFEDKDALEEEALHFLQCVRDRTTPLTDGKKGLDVIKVLVYAGNALAITNNNKEYFAHESAYIDGPVKIGKGTQLWHFTHVMAGAEIGERCKIGQNVLVAKNVKIGNNVKIQNNVSVYEGVILEDDVFCGPSMVFTNVKTPRSAFPRNTSEDYLTTLVKQGVSIGANATIVCGVTIGKHALIGAGAVVAKDVPDYAVVYGNPGIIHGWACPCGSVVIGKDESMLECSRCNTKLNIN